MQIGLEIFSEKRDQLCSWRQANYRSSRFIVLQLRWIVHRLNVDEDGVDVIVVLKRFVVVIIAIRQIDISLKKEKLLHHFHNVSFFILDSVMKIQSTIKTAQNL